MDPDQTAPLGSGSTLFAVCKNRFEKFARIFSRRQKQTTFSDADFLGNLRINRGLDGNANLFKCMGWGGVVCGVGG